MSFMAAPFLRLLEVPLDGSTTICCISHSSKDGVICMFAEGTFCLLWVRMDECQVLTKATLSLPVLNWTGEKKHD